MQVSNVFSEAKKYRYSVILIDDCESVFPTRDWMKAESWHIAQNNVFFHELSLPSKETLKEIAKFKCAQLRMESDFAIKAIEKENFRTVRELERLITESYIDRIVKKDI